MLVFLLLFYHCLLYGSQSPPGERWEAGNHRGFACAHPPISRARIATVTSGKYDRDIDEGTRTLYFLKFGTVPRGKEMDTYDGNRIPLLPRLMQPFPTPPRT